MNISIYGLGYVGCVSMGCLAEMGHKVIGVDLDKSKVDQINNGCATIVEKKINNIIAKQKKNNNIQATTDNAYAVHHSEISIICVGTPSAPDGSLDLSAVFSVAHEIGRAIKNKSEFHVVALRSTVLPGTCDKLTKIITSASGKISDEDFSVVSNPEFLREGSAVSDYFHPPYTLIGSNNDKATKLMEKIYQDIDAEFIVAELQISEIMKYINNSFHALKIAFANEVGNICKKLNIDSHNVMDIFVRDTQLNISPYYLKPGFAFGGSCLPKDLKALQTLAHDLYLKTHIINTIDKSNNEQIKRAKDLIKKYNIKNISIFGISFKAGTDDLRNSPVISLVKFLIENQCSIRIFDYNVNCAILAGTNKNYINSHIADFKNFMFDTMEKTLKGSEMVIIGNSDNNYLKSLKEYQGIIFDLVRLDESLINKKNYFGINW